MDVYNKIVLDAIAAFQFEYYYPAINTTAVIDSQGLTVSITELKPGRIGRIFQAEITFETGEQLQFFKELSEGVFENQEGAI